MNLSAPLQKVTSRFSRSWGKAKARNFLSWSNAAPGAVGAAAHLRRAQAVELLRCEFLRASQARKTTAVDDLDDLVRETKCRPSLLIEIYGLAGAVMGRVALVAPQTCSDVLANVVHDVAEQSFNDSIRDMGSDSSVQDVREALKYHRDFRSSMTARNDDGSSGSTSSGPSSSATIDARLEAARAVLTTGLVNAVKIADSL